VDATSRKELQRTWGQKEGGGECQVMARLWYCSKVLQPAGGFESGRHGFLPVTNELTKWVLKANSWVPVVAVQKVRVRVRDDYAATDTGVLSLKKGVSATALVDDDNGWALVRTDLGEEGWFPVNYIRLIHKYVEVEKEEDKVIEAYKCLQASYGVPHASQGSAMNVRSVVDSENKEEEEEEEHPVLCDSLNKPVDTSSTLELGETTSLLRESTVNNCCDRNEYI